MAAQLPGERNERTGASTRRHRHVAGSAAWKKAGRPPGSYPPDRPLCYSVAPAEANRMDTLLATGRWRTNKRQRVDADNRHGSCPNEGGVSCKGRDRCVVPGAALAKPSRSET